MAGRVQVSEPVARVLALLVAPGLICVLPCRLPLLKSTLKRGTSPFGPSRLAIVIISPSGSLPAVFNAPLADTVKLP
jgi:hypothetical protein